jgi:hypothetical protein
MLASVIVFCVSRTEVLYLSRKLIGSSWEVYDCCANSSMGYDWKFLAAVRVTDAKSNVSEKCLGT